eukprot:3657844-Pleurochrysis_carterae.AAC.2
MEQRLDSRSPDHPSYPTPRSGEVSDTTMGDRLVTDIRWMSVTSLGSRTMSSHEPAQQVATPAHHPQGTGYEYAIVAVRDMGAS